MKEIGLVLLCCFLFSCDEGGLRKKPVATGKYGEIYVIVDDDLLTKNLKQALNAALQRPQLFYGGEEPYFKLVYLSPNQAKGSLVYEGTTLILTRSGVNSGIRKILPEKVDSAVTLRKREGVHTFLKQNVWATQQSVLFILGDHPDSLANYISLRNEQLLGKVLEMERKEAIGRMTLNPDEKLRKEISQKHAIDVRVPISYHVASNSKINDNEGFIWLRNEGTDFDLNVVIHYQPYTDTSQFALQNLIARRDSVVKPYITGETKGSFMATDNQFPYYLQTVDFNGNFAREYTALWTLENDFMGGPYYSVTVHDEKNKRLITLEGFVYAPNEAKTRYLRELQGILYGVRF
ncbi:MAG TPA: hypothetical protein DIW47_07715 [Bacteroidetes bacterium]|nr:hypothetical protein [Bacteroidota bacterium]